VRQVEFGLKKGGSSSVLEVGPLLRVLFPIRLKADHGLRKPRERVFPTQLLNDFLRDEIFGVA